VSVLAHVERTADTLLLAILTDSLRDRCDVRYRERPVERRASVAAGAERHPLPRVGRVRSPLEEFALERCNIDQRSWWGRLPR
jgi:hypothetical protein